MPAGRHARLYASIWDDDDFRSLAVTEQRLYIYLLSQPNMTHLGVLPLTFKRWSLKQPKGYSADHMRADLRTLHEARYIVLDENSEELLVRTVLRNDNVYKQPNTLRAAEKSAEGVTSEQIKQVLVSEIDRINLEAEVPEDAKRESARKGLLALRKSLGNVPWNPSPNPSRGVSEDEPEPLFDPPTRTGARTRRARPLPLPLPPSPSPTAGSKDEQTAVETNEQRIARLTRTYTDRVPLSAYLAVAGVVRKAVRSGLYTDEQILRALDVLHDEQRPVTADSLRIALTGGPKRRGSEPPVVNYPDADYADHWGNPA